MKFLMYQAQIKDEGPKTPPSIIHELKRCQPHLYIDVFFNISITNNNNIIIMIINT